MDESVDADVLVIGAGPIGLTAAVLLADQGLRVLLVERNPSVSDEPRAISITDESLRVMAQIGVLERLLPEMLVDTGARYFGRKGQLLAEVAARVPRLGQPVKSQFDQPILVNLLLEAVRARPAIEVRFGVEASRLADHPGHVEADLSATSADSDRQSAERVRARWIVACDGGRSPVRTALGIALEGSTQVEKWIVVDVLNSPGTPERFSQFHCNGVRPGVVVPGVKGRCRYEFMLLPGEDVAAVTAPAFIIALVAPYQRIVAGDIRRAAVYVAQQRIAARYRAGRVLLAGDAAHLMPPFAGQGLNAGIRDVANLAWKIAAHVRGEAGDALIDSYPSERRPHAEEMVRISHRIGKVVMSRQPLLTALRDRFITGLGIVPPAKRWLVGMKFLKQPHITSGCVVPAAKGVAPAAAASLGRSLSQPRMMRASGELVALDVLLGAGWAILRFPNFPKASSVEVQRSAGAATGRDASVETVDDSSGGFASLHGSGAVLVVRPDRYVAAVAAGAAGEQQVLQALRRWMPQLAAQLGPVAARAGAAPREAVAAL